MSKITAKVFIPPKLPCPIEKYVSWFFTRSTSGTTLFVSTFILVASSITNVFHAACFCNHGGLYVHVMLLRRFVFQ